MNRSELVGRLAQSTGLTIENARLAIEGLFGTPTRSGVIATTLRCGDRVQLTGFGTFETRMRGERRGRNPRTLENIVIPAGLAPAFRPATGLKTSLRDGSGVDA